jgi:hypothetical protein
LYQFERRFFDRTHRYTPLVHTSVALTQSSLARSLRASKAASVQIAVHLLFASKRVSYMLPYSQRLLKSDLANTSTGGRFVAEVGCEPTFGFGDGN